MENNISPILISKINSQNNTSLNQNNNVQSTLTSTNEIKQDTFIKRNSKKIAIGTGVFAFAALSITAIAAFFRGKTINGDNSKLTQNLADGFKSFFGKNKQAYLNAKNNKVQHSVDIPSKAPGVGDKPIDKVDVEPHKNITMNTSKEPKRTIVTDSNPNEILMADIEGVQAKAKNLDPHSYNMDELPDININCKGYRRDFDAYDIIDGKTYHTNIKKALEVRDNIPSIDNTNYGVVFGKNNEDEIIVSLCVPSGRKDYAGRGVFTKYSFSSPAEKGFDDIQLDIIKAFGNKDARFFAQEAPLGSATKVINPDKGIYGGEDVIFDLDTLLREINHYAKNCEMPKGIVEQIKEIEQDPTGKFISLCC